MWPELLTLFAKVVDGKKTKKKHRKSNQMQSLTSLKAISCHSTIVLYKYQLLSHHLTILAWAGQATTCKRHPVWAWWTPGWCFLCEKSTVHCEYCVWRIGKRKSWGYLQVKHTAKICPCVLRQKQDQADKVSTLHTLDAHTLHKQCTGQRLHKCLALTMTYCSKRCFPTSVSTALRGSSRR